MAQPGTKQGGEVDTLYSHSSSILCRNLHVFSPEPLMQNPDSLCKLDISANLHRLRSKQDMQRPLCDRPPQTRLRIGNDQPSRTVRTDEHREGNECYRTCKLQMAQNK